MQKRAADWMLVRRVLEIRGDWIIGKTPAVEITARGRGEAQGSLMCVLDQRPAGTGSGRHEGCGLSYLPGGLLTLRMLGLVVDLERQPVGEALGVNLIRAGVGVERRSGQSDGQVDFALEAVGFKIVR